MFGANNPDKNGDDPTIESSDPFLQIPVIHHTNQMSFDGGGPVGIGLGLGGNSKKANLFGNSTDGGSEINIEQQTEDEAILLI